MDVTVIVNGHREGILARRTLRAARAAVNAALVDGISVELIGVLDTHDIETRVVFDEFCDWKIEVENADLGLSRNAGVAVAHGKYVCFCDADDLFGTTWIRDAFRLAEKMGAAVLHPQLSCFFGDVERSYLREHVGSEDPRFDYDVLTQYNIWSALCFARRDVLLATPYVAVGNGCGYEDWQFNMDTLAKGVPHVAVPNTIHWIRIKAANSLCRSLSAANTVCGPTNFYAVPRGRRYVIKRKPAFDSRWLTAESAAANIIDPQCWADDTMRFEGEHPARAADAIWAGVAAARRAVVVITPLLGLGGVPNVVRNLVRFYARRYEHVVVLVTEGAAEKIDGAVCVDLFAGCPNLTQDERAFALQTVLVQLQPTAIHAVNSPLTMGVLRLNPACLRRTAKFYAWTFGMGRLPSGRQMASVFWDLPHVWKHVDAVITDSHYWADHLQSIYGYPAGLLHVVRQPVAVDFRPTDWTTEPLKVLWAGRMEPEKGLDFLFDVYRQMRWGQIQLLVAGSGSLETKVPLHLPGVTYVGPYTDFNQLPDAQIFIMTSPAEGAAQVLLEAQARGMVPLVPRVGGLPEICYGGYVVPRTVESFVSTLVEIVGNREWLEGRAALGANTVAENHCWESFVSDVSAAIG